MNQPDLDFVNSKSITELREIQSHIHTRIEELEKSAKNAILEQIHQIAAAAGVDLAELIAAGKPGPKKSADGRGKVAPKYRNPANAAETWTGRGKHPKWVSEALAAGGTLESLLIDPANQ